MRRESMKGVTTTETEEKRTDRAADEVIRNHKIAAEGRARAEQKGRDLETRLEAKEKENEELKKANATMQKELGELRAGNKDTGKPTATDDTKKPEMANNYTQEDWNQIQEELQDQATKKSAETEKSATPDSTKDSEMVNNYTKEDWNQIQEELKKQADNKNKEQPTTNSVPASPDTKQKPDEPKTTPDKKFDDQTKTPAEQEEANRKNAEDLFPENPDNPKVTEPTPENAPAPEIKPDIAKETLSSKDLFGMVVEGRERLVAAERALREARKNEAGNSGIFELEWEKANEEYRNLVARYAQTLYTEKVDWLESKGYQKGTPAFEEALSSMKRDIFHNTVMELQDSLAKEKYDSLEPRKRTWFRKMLEGYNKMPRWKKILIGSTVCTVGSAAIFGSSIGAAALLGGVSMRFVRGMVGAKVGAFTGGLVKSIFGKRVEAYRTNELARLNTDFGAKMNSMNSIDDWRSLIAQYNRDYEGVVTEVNKKHRRINAYAIGAGIAAGGVAAWASGPAFDHFGFGKPSAAAVEAPSRPQPELMHGHTRGAYQIPEQPEAATPDAQTSAGHESMTVDQDSFNHPEGTEGAQEAAVDQEAVDQGADTAASPDHYAPPYNSDFGSIQGKFAEMLRMNTSNPLISEENLTNLKMDSVINNNLGGHGDNFITGESGNAYAPNPTESLQKSSDMVTFQSRLDDMFNHLPLSEQTQILRSGMSVREFLENTFAQ